MSVLDDLEALDRNREKPPSHLYKYVSPDRIDVLRKSKIRFTSPLNTNDIFEVRQSFDLIVGPLMQSALRELIPSLDIDEQIRDAADELGLQGMSVDDIVALAGRSSGLDLRQVLQSQVGTLINLLPQVMNSPEQVNRVLERFAGSNRLLSLSESADISPMWAHYGANSEGFVIAFDTASDFFLRGENSDRNGLHKVQYFDGRVPEIMENPYVALISKQAAWSYEREWRLYIASDKVTETIRNNELNVDLVEFPRDAVTMVVLGARASPQLQDSIRMVLAEKYPHAQLTRLVANRATASFEVQPV